MGGRETVELMAKVVPAGKGVNVIMGIKENRGGEKKKKHRFLEERAWPWGENVKVARGGKEPAPIGPVTGKKKKKKNCRVAKVVSAGKVEGNEGKGGETPPKKGRYRPFFQKEKSDESKPSKKKGKERRRGS